MYTQNTVEGCFCVHTVYVQWQGQWLGQGQRQRQGQWLGQGRRLCQRQWQGRRL